MAVILHIVPRNAWTAAQTEGTYRGDTLASEGFIHFSRPDQVVQVANARFKGHNGLQLLVVDPERLTAPLRHEAPYEFLDREPSEQALFPHLYGELNLDAVVAVVDFEPGADGLFTPPELGDG